MKKAASFALGCKVNQYESEAIGELFAAHGYEIVGIEEKADVYVINTCTVTNFGDKKSRQLIRRVKRQNPNAVVAVVGCYAQTAPEELLQVEGVNLVIGTKDRNQIVELVESCSAQSAPKSYVADIMKERVFEPLSIGKLDNRTRAYLKIQDGCSQFCSYCIIPYARGPIRSRPVEEVLAEVKRLADNGFREVVLTGIHVASYGKDLKNISFLDLIEQVHKVDGIHRIRFSSIEPNVATEDFVKGIAALPKVCDHFHLSLQSGCDKTLKAMKRRYNTSQYKMAVERIRKALPNAAFTTDIIVGFPQEQEEDFEASYQFAKEIGFAKIHVFPYSPKKGTPAASMSGQIPNAVKSERSKKLIALSDKMAEDFIQTYINREMAVLFERQLENGFYEGHTTNYIQVRAKSSQNLKNQEVFTLLIKQENGIAEATVTKL